MSFHESTDRCRDTSLPLNDVRGIDRALANIYALLGPETTLISVPSGKTVSDDSVRSTTLVESLKPGPQSELRKSNVAVQCGQQSRGLYGIRFNRQADHEAFLETNPALRNTLAIEREGAVAIFIRIPEPMPPSFGTASGGWFGEGAIISVFNREDPTAIKILSPQPPVELPFAQISWSADLVLGFRRFMAEVKYGAPFLQDKKSNWNLNPMFWAEWFSTASGIAFQPHAQEFLVRGQDGSCRTASDVAVERALLEFITNYRGNAPAESVSESTLKKCLQALKVIAADPHEHATGAEHLERFLTETVEPCDGHDLTSEELHSRYRTWSKTTKIIPLAGRQFFTTLAGCVARVFGAGKNHCTPRDGTERRGYAGLQFKEAPLVQDAKDA